jgi:hypothetical protein
MESCLMIINQGLKTQFVITRVLVCVCVLLVGTIKVGCHHHEDEKRHETCLLCVLFDIFSGFISSEVPSIICRTELHTFIVSYPIYYFNNTNLFYQPRSPPFLQVYSNKFPQ